MPKPSVPLPPQEMLERMFNYHPETGELFWKARTVDMFRDTVGRTKEHACAQWNSRWAKKRAMSKAWDGYLGGSLNYNYVAAHRVIWKLMYGDDAEIIDHINGKRDDNRLENLRNVTYAENARNRRLGANNTSGMIGVGFNKRQQKWTASINLGSFDTKEEAMAERKRVQDLLGFHENHGLPRELGEN